MSLDQTNNNSLGMGQNIISTAILVGPNSKFLYCEVNASPLFYDYQNMNI